MSLARHDLPGPCPPDAVTPDAVMPDGEPTNAVTPDAEPTDDAPQGLDERDQAILDIERQWWRRAGAKEQAVRERLGLTSTRYYQLLNVLVDRPEALAADPVLVTRLRRQRAERTRSRSSSSIGGR